MSRMIAPAIPSKAGSDRRYRGFTTKATMSFRMNGMAFDTVRYCGLGGSLTGWLKNYLRGQEGGVLSPPQPASSPHPQPLSPREGGEGGRRPGEGVQFGGPEGPVSCGDGYDGVGTADLARL